MNETELQTDGQKYYNQPELWQNIAEYQKNVLKDISMFIPSDVESILDVGCGNGYLINTLAKQFNRCAGIDISETALQMVQVEKKIGSAEAIPYPDNAFDLLLINDVLEHLPAETLKKALAELRRVARKYIIVTVPFLENLQAGMTCCGNCGTVYHITRHVHSFGAEELIGLFGGDLRPARLIYSGSEHCAHDLFQYEIRAKLHLCTKWDQAVCPVCGANASTIPLNGTDVYSCYGNIASLPADPPFMLPLRNECIALYHKDKSGAHPIADTGISLRVDGKVVESAFTVENGVRFLRATPVDGYCCLEFAANGIIYTYPRPSFCEDDRTRIAVPAWFNNNTILLSGAELHEALRYEGQLLRQSINEKTITAHAEQIEKLTANYEGQLLRQSINEKTITAHAEQIEKLTANFDQHMPSIQKISELQESILEKKISRYTWAQWKSNVLKRAEPDIVAHHILETEKHFLVISHDQDIDRRIIQQVEALVQNGWTGVIVCLSFDNEDHLDNRDGYLVHRVGLKHIVPKCKCYWRYQRGLFLSNKYLKWKFRSLFNKFCGIAYRVYTHLYYRCAAIKYPLPFDYAFFKAARNYPSDLIIAEDLPALEAAALLKRERQCRLIFDSHEFYPEQKVFSRKQKKIMHQTAMRFLPDCNYVITVSDGIADCFVRFYGIGKPVVIHNVTDWEEIGRGHRFHELFGLDQSQKVILYQGGIIPQRNIENLLRGFCKLDPQDTHLVFLGPSDPVFLKQLRKIAGHLQDTRIHFLDAIPREELPAWTASADFGVVPYKVIDLNTRYCMPNKFFEFIQAGLPILSNNLIEVDKVIKMIGGGGMVANLNSPGNVALALGEMLKRDLTDDRQKLCRARQTFSWDQESREFLRIVRQAME